MRRQFVLPLALLFIALGVPSNAQSAGESTTAEPVAALAGDATPLTQHFYEVGRIVFTLNCSALARANPDGYVWKKNGTAVEQVWDLRDRYSFEEGGAVFRMNRTHEDDFGNYTCSSGGNSLGWEVRGLPYARLPADTNVVEGQRLKIVCRVTGKPYPAVTWTFRNSSEGNLSEVQAALGARAELRRSEAGVEDGELVIKAAERGDAGVYVCTPAGGRNDTTTLRVKDQFAALWPFLGICAEVFVLCAIILVYEKRRTKPELDDSDTDNHDQKKS